MAPRGDTMPRANPWESALPTSDCSSSLQALNCSRHSPKHPLWLPYPSLSPTLTWLSYFTVLFLVIAFSPCFQFCIVVSLVFSTHFHLWICLLACYSLLFYDSYFYLPFPFLFASVWNTQKHWTQHCPSEGQRSSLIHQSTGTSPLAGNHQAWSTPHYGRFTIVYIPLCRKFWLMV